MFQTKVDYKILITTSGTGSRLKSLTKTNNKALVEINDKKVISYIVDAYPTHIPLVITIGYYGDQVKQFLQQEYPDRDITFVIIEKYKGSGSSLGYSMLQAREYLQCPFIFHCNDTIVFDSIPSPKEYNWNGGGIGNDPIIFNTANYASFTKTNNKLNDIQPKGANSYDLFHIGLVGIKNYQLFWEGLATKYKENPNDQALNDVAAIKEMLKQGETFMSVVFKNWLDTGNLESFTNAKNYIAFVKAI